MNHAIHPDHDPSRRKALSCLAAWTGAAVVWSVVGGVPRALGATNAGTAAAAAKNALTFVQISDTHIGFHKEANPDVVGSLRRAIADINALPQAPALVVHTGDVSHLSKPEEFGQAQEMLQEIHVDRVHTIPGEHDALDDGLNGYLKFFDHDGKGRAWYSFDQGGVHFIGLSNVLNFKMGTMTSLGDEQIAWLKKDLARVSHSTPIVVLAHIPMWTVYAPWGWGTADARAGAGAAAAVRIGDRAQRTHPSGAAERSKATSRCTPRCRSPTRCPRRDRKASANPGRSRCRPANSASCSARAS